MWYRYYLLFIFACVPLVGQAQFDLGSLQTPGQTGSIVLSPAFPAPGESVTATVDAGSNVFGSEITWTYDGAVLDDAANRRSAAFMAGAAGTDKTLTVTLRSSAGTQQSISTTISPIYLDLIVEPQTRVPDWYQGRALPSFNSQINATALLHNGADFIDSNNIVYSWRIDKQAIEAGTVRGGNKVSFTTPRGRAPILSVSAATLQGETIASRVIQLNTALPELVYYEKHSLYGLSHIPIRSSAALVGSVLTLQAEPFYLDTRVYNRPDIAQWEINNIDTDNGSSNPYEITLSRAGSGGRTILNFHVRSLQEVLQGVEGSVLVNF